MHRLKFMLIIMLFGLSILVPGCGTEQKKVTFITVSAAASLTDLLQEMKAKFEKENPGSEIVLNFGASGVLQKQIQQGAPADIFISASGEYMDQLEKQDLLLAGSRQNILENELVLITPKEDTLSGFQELVGEKVGQLAIATPESAPVGKYAREVLLSLGLWDSVESKVVYAKDARQVLTFVESGNVPAGIVYRTDAAGSEKATIVVAAPPGSHAPIVYPVAVVKSSSESQLAQKFVDYILSKDGLAVCEKYGFKIAGSD